MKLLVDECCEASLVQKLRKEGYDVTYVPEMEPGITDGEVLEEAFKENRVLVTDDKDFGELIFRLQLPAKGIILLRFGINEKQLKSSRLISALKKLGEKIEGNFVVIDKLKIRVSNIE